MKPSALFSPAGAVRAGAVVALLILAAVFLPGATTPAATVTSLVAVKASLTVGEVETLTATVTAAGMPVTGGTVTFLDGTAVVGVVQLVGTAAGGNSVGTATLRTNGLSVGTHTVTARYDGDDSDGSSSAAAQTVTVSGQYPTVTSLAAAGAPGSYDLTATVQAFGVGTPAGSVGFDDQTGGSSLGTAALDPTTVKTGFTPAATMAVASGPYASVVGDFNNDGIPDVAAVDTFNGSVAILLGDGKGGFLPAKYVAVPPWPGEPAQPEALAIGDFNGDGNEDLVEVGSFQMGVLLGDGKGNFQASTIGVFQPKEYATARLNVVVGDFNRDGNEDIAESNGGMNLEVFLGDGTGNFAMDLHAIAMAPMPTVWPFDGSGLAVGDVNGDGLPDLVFSDFRTGQVQVALGNGDGSFRLGWYGVVAPETSAVVLADVNGDGKPDLLVADPLNQQVIVLRNDGAGNFAQIATVATGMDPTDVAVGDFNGDGKLDLAVVNHGDNTVTFDDGDGTGHFTPGPTIEAGNGAQGVTAADVNGDGRMDLVVANDRSDTVEVFDQVTSGTAVLHAVALPGAGIQAVTARYGGDARHLASAASNAVYLTESPVATTVALGLQPASGVTAGMVVRLTATVTPHAENGAVAGGVVAFSDGGTVLGSSPLSADGTASFDAAGLSSGSHSFSASYGGDADFAASQTAQAAALTVGPAPGTAAAPTAVTLTATPATGTRGGVVTLVAEVSSGGQPVTDGQVTFMDGTAVLGTVQVVSDAAAGFTTGTATLKTNTLRLGAHTVTAQYAGDRLHAPSAPAAQTVTVSGQNAVNLTVVASYGGTHGVYSLGGDLQAFGRPAAGGTITIYDQTASNSVLDQEALVPAQATRNFETVSAGLAGNGPAMVVAADFNDDGIPDLATADQYGNTVGILTGDGLGDFKLQAMIPVGNAPAALAEGDFNGDGNADLAVANGADGTVTILLGDGKGGFTPAAILPVGKSPSGIAVGDVNGDGVPDLVVTNRGDNTASVFLGDGTGGFGLAATVATGKQPAAAVIADLNHDGFADLAVANAEGNSVSILAGNGDGTFQAGSTITVETDPESIAAGDLNGDGNTDLVVGCSGEDPDVLTGDGKGGFTAARTGDVKGVSAGFWPSAVGIADLNGDGHPDIAVSNWWHGGFVAWEGDGQGNFTQLAAVRAGYNVAQVTGLAVVDANGDGMPDVVTVDGRSNLAQVFAGYAQESFASPEMVIPGSGTHVITESYSGDSNYVAGQGSNTVTVPATAVKTAITLAAGDLSGRAPGQPVTLMVTVTPNQVNGMTAGGTVTFNQDGVLLGTEALAADGAATLTTSALTAGGHAFTASYDGDANFDGSQTAGTTVVWVQQTTVTALTASPASLPVGAVETLTATVTVAGAAVDGGTVTFLDGPLPLRTVQVTANGVATLRASSLGPGAHAVTARYNAGSAVMASTSAAETVTVSGTYPTSTTLAATGGAGSYSFTATVSGMGAAPSGGVTFADDTENATLGTAQLDPASAAFGFTSAAPLNLGQQTDGPGMIVTGDFNNDGYQDVAVLPSWGSTVELFLGNGDGAFKAESVALNGLANGLAAGDFNGDGNLDLAVLTGPRSTVSIYAGDGNGHFTLVSSITGNASSLLGVADFNGDGHADLAVASYELGMVQILLGDGKGNLTGGEVIPFDGNNGDVLMGDFNGDGRPDFATFSATTDAIALYLGNGDGTFSKQGPIHFAKGMWLAAAADLNADGCTDLIAEDDVNETVTILLNDGKGNFTAVATETGTGVASQIVPGDFNGDGHEDLFIYDLYDTKGLLLLGDGKGGFRSFTVPVSVQGMIETAARLNGNPRTDLLVADSTGTVLNLLLPESSTTATLPHAAIVGTGSHEVSASYGGDEEYAGSSAAKPLPVVAKQAASSIALTASENPVRSGYPEVLTAAVTQAAGVEAPTGTVTFFDGQTQLGTAALEGSGTAAWTIASIDLATHAFTAQYAGDQNYLASTTATPLTVTVNPGAPAAVTLTLTASETSGNYGDSIALTAKATSATGTPTGTVTFTQDGVTLGTADLDARGQAVLTTKKLPGGTDSVTASLAASSNFAAAASAPLAITLSPAADYTITSDVSTLTVQTGQSATANLTLTPVNGFDQSVGLSCGTLPAGVTCGFKPASVSLAGGPGTMVLTVSVAASAAAPPVTPPAGDSSPWRGLALAATLLAGLGLLLTGSRKRRLAGVVLLAAALAGCGGGAAPAPSTPSTPSILGSHPVTITATSTTGGAGGTAVTHTLPVTIVIQ